MAFFNKLSIRNRLFFAFGCIILIMTGFTVLSIVQVNRMIYRYHGFVQTAIAGQEYIDNAVDALGEMRIYTVMGVYFADYEGLYNAIIQLHEAARGYDEVFLNYLTSYRQNAAIDLYLTEEQREIRVQKTYYIEHLFINYYQPAVKVVVDAVESNNREGLIPALGLAAFLGSELSAQMWQLRNETFEATNDARALLESRTTTANMLVAIQIASIIILSLAFAVWMVKAIQIPITKLKSAMAEVAGGNLTYPIRTGHDDEFGLLSCDIANMVDSISKMNKATTMADYLDTMICVTDAKYQLVYVNRSYADAFGIDKDDYEGKLCYEATYCLEDPCDLCAFSEVEVNEAGSFHDFGIIWDGRLNKWLEIRAAIELWPDGRLVRLKYINDATEKKLSMDQQYGNKAKIQKALEETREASVAKSAFIACVSHELRTPINSILGYSEIALDDQVSGPTKEYLKKIIKNTEWLLDVVNDIIDLSMIESGMLKLENIPFEIKDVLDQCQKIIEPKSAAKDLVLYFYTEPQLGKRLVGDPNKLKQICVNLLSNAVKFTKYGTVKCTVSLMEAGQNDCTLLFEVRDSGIGMTEDQIAYIFEPFAIENFNNTRTHTGVSLGLAITQKLIEAMSGKLTVESAVGIGSKFSFVLKLPTTDARTDYSSGSFTQDKEIEKPYFDEGEVLIVEDDEMNEGVIREYLKRVGLKYDVVSDGREAVAMVRKRILSGLKPFGLILMDVHMPHMDGLEASSIIAGWDITTPIVAMTANTMSVMEESYKNHGMDDCIKKPFAARDLWRILLKYFVPVDYPHDRDVVQSAAPPPEEEVDDIFFKKMLLHFVKSNKDIYDKISDAILAGDMILAHRLVHNIKSNAGHIKKTALQKTANALEQEIKEKRLSDGLLQVFKTELETVLKELMPLLEEEAPLSSLSLSKEEIRKIIEELEPLLNSGNVEYLDYVEQVKAMPGSEALVEHIENFDSVAASVALNQLKRKWM